MHMKNFKNLPYSGQYLFFYKSYIHVVSSLFQPILLENSSKEFWKIHERIYNFFAAAYTVVNKFLQNHCILVCTKRKGKKGLHLTIYAW